MEITLQMLQSSRATHAYSRLQGEDKKMRQAIILCILLAASIVHAEDLNFDANSAFDQNISIDSNSDTEISIDGNREVPAPEILPEIEVIFDPIDENEFDLNTNMDINLDSNLSIDPVCVQIKFI